MVQIYPTILLLAVSQTSQILGRNTCADPNPSAPQSFSLLSLAAPQNNNIPTTNNNNSNNSTTTASNSTTPSNTNSTLPNSKSNSTSTSSPTSAQAVNPTAEATPSQFSGTIIAIAPGSTQTGIATGPNDS